MKLKLSLLLVFVGIFTNAQHQKLTPKEKAFIQEAPAVMRVLQVTDKEDLKILKATSRPVNPKEKSLKVLSEKMLATMIEEKGVGIAAPQVGLNINVFWVQRFDKENKPFEFFINPVIVWKSKAYQYGREGCLSIPNERGDVYRSLVIEVTYNTLEGEKKQEIIEGFTAVIFQHEYDHLFGKLFTERIEEQQSIDLQKKDVFTPSKIERY